MLRPEEYGLPLISDINGKSVESVGSGKEQKAYAYLYSQEEAENRGVDDKSYIKYLDFPSDSQICHLSLYYLERGAGDANCNLSFNLPVAPTREIRVAKEVTTANENELQNREFEFHVVSSEDYDVLLDYRENGNITSDTTVTKKKISISDSEYETIDILPNLTYFYIEEMTPGERVEWSVIKTPGVVSVEGGPEAELGKSSIYQVVDTKTGGFLVNCNNYYDNMTPDYHKRAWKDFTSEDSIYDLTLEVTGDTAKDVGSGQDRGKLEKLVITDTISDNVKFPDPVNDGVNAPNLYLTNGAVAGSSSDSGKSRIDLGTRLTAVVDGGSVNYSHNSGTIASYDISSRTLTWNIANELGANETKTLAYRVKAIGNYKEDPSEYPNLANSDTGTHANDNGYYSNDRAYLEYDGMDTEKYPQGLPLPHPVVRPDEIQYGSFILEKQVSSASDDPNETGTYGYSFKINIEDKEGASYITDITLEDGKTLTAGGDGSYEVTLFPGKSIEIPLPEGFSYSIEEQPFANGEYATTKTWVNGMLLSVGESVEGKISSSETPLYRFENLVEKYKILKVIKNVYGKTGGTYNFTISNPDCEYGNGGITEITGGKFEISVPEGEDSGFKELKVNPNITSAFTITEENVDQWKTVSAVTDRKEDSEVTTREAAGKPTWPTGSITISGVKAGDTVTFNNYYYALTLKKEVTEGNNPDRTKEYDFALTFDLKEGQTLTPEEKSGITLDTVTSYTWEDNTIKTSLKDKNSAKLTGLTAAIAEKIVSIEITETIIGQTGINRFHLEEVWVDETESELNSDANGITFKLPTEPENYNQTITFKNKYQIREGALQIVKKLVGEDGKTSEDALKPQTFTFKIEHLGQDKKTDMTFYKTITVPAESSEEATEVFMVPIGSYKITEMDTMQYEVVDVKDKTQTAEVTVEYKETNPYIVTFTNKKLSEHYFTDTDCAVNTVELNESKTDYIYTKQTPLQTGKREEDES